jgi:hypothetical protein
MTSRAPKRLSDDPTTSSGLRVALRPGADELPNAEELRRVRAKLAAQMGDLVREIEVASDGDAQGGSQALPHGLATSGHALAAAQAQTAPRKRTALLVAALLSVAAAAGVYFAIQ